MATVELRLNSRKPGNYAFFCPVTKIHLTLANPVGMTNGVSPYILRGIKSKTLIDVNGAIDLETGKINGKSTKTEKPAKIEEPKKEELVKSEAAVTEQKEEEKSFQEAEVVADEKKNKKGRKPQNADAE